MNCVRQSAKRLEEVVQGSLSDGYFLDFRELADSPKSAINRSLRT